VDQATGEKRREHLLHLRDELLQSLAETDRALSETRMQVERAESDIRIGASPASDYEEMKGHVLPRLEADLRQTYAELLKIEDKIVFTANESA
jgi:hypothetical protein